MRRAPRPMPCSSSTTRTCEGVCVSITLHCWLEQLRLLPAKCKEAAADTHWDPLALKEQDQAPCAAACTCCCAARPSPHCLDRLAPLLALPLQARRQGVPPASALHAVCCQQCPALPRLLGLGPRRQGASGIVPLRAHVPCRGICAHLKASQCTRYAAPSLIQQVVLASLTMPKSDYSDDKHGGGWQGGRHEACMGHAWGMHGLCMQTWGMLASGGTQRGQVRSAPRQPCSWLLTCDDCCRRRAARL